MRETLSETAAGQAPDLDEKVLLRLFDLAGAVQTREILDRLILDLRGVQETFDRAQDQAGAVDIGLLRRQNHTLIGIAGTVGAVPLHGLALEAGRLLRDAKPDVVEILGPLHPPVARLIQHLVQMRANR